ncbi:hypothetical protein [Candidatus Methanoplasma termitum]|nr:hypothetical protein [Candidatus Methanoplasma termitum]MCL2333272.1 hypothetical protein [Candidatus Methanoplasma sp.]
MAKKRHRVEEKKEEEYQFIPSEFDEREFILKDIYGTKVLFVITALAIIVGIVGAILYNISPSIGWAPATAIAFLMILGMKKLLILLGYRVDLLETKTLLADYFLFLMLALGVCILGINL